MKPLTREEKEVLKIIFNDRLEKTMASIEKAAWDQAAARCRDLLAGVFAELLLEKTLDTWHNRVPEAETALPTASTDLEDKVPSEKQVETKQANTRQQNNATEHKSTGHAGYIYLYCLAPVEAAILFHEAIVPGLPDGGKVRVIESGRLAAVVSSVPDDKYNAEALEEALTDRQWLESSVTAHEDVIQIVMKHFPVIPMKFCTIFHTVDRVKQLIDKRALEFNELLDSVSGKEEWGLKIYYNPSVLRRNVEASSKRIREANEQAEAKGVGAAYFIRKKMDDLIAEETEHTAASLVNEVHTELAKYAEEAIRNPLLGSEVTGKLETMALNAVYFVKQDILDMFKAKVKEFSEKYSDLGFELAFTGPWPPYNFTQVGNLEGGDEK